jgi:hypothetical protein
MFSSRLRQSLVAPLLGFALAGIAHAADALTGASPFLPPSSSATAATPDTAIELRGITVNGNTALFSIYDSAHHTSAWLHLNETGREFVVRSYDATRDSVTVDFQGRTLTLALHTAKVASAPVVPLQPVGRPAIGGPQPIGGPVVLNPTPADEQRRLEAIAAEVNRRRMLRQQALQASRQAADQAGRPNQPLPMVQPGQPNPNQTR